MDDPGEQLKFPVTCPYSVVTFADAKNIQADLDSVIATFNLETRAEKGRLSENGKYQSWTFSCTIPDLKTLRAVNTALAAIDGVKVVL